MKVRGMCGVLAVLLLCFSFPVGSAIVDNSTTFAPMPTSSVDKHVYSTYKYLQIIEPPGFAHCTTEFSGACEPALQGNSTLDATWEAVHSHCAKLYCSCLPGGTLVEYNGAQTCAYRRPSTFTEMCVFYEDCVPIYDQCVANFVWGNDTMPRACSPFLSCVQRPDVVELDFKACVHYRTIQAFGCNHSRTCSYIRTPVNMTKRLEEARDLFPSDGSGSSSGRTSRLTFSHRKTSNLVLIAMLVGVIVSLFLAVGVFFAQNRHRMAMETAANDIPAERLLRLVVRDVDLYEEDSGRTGSSEDCSLSAATASGTIVEEEEERTCTYCESSAVKFILLPCRCFWCGCLPPRGMRRGKIPLLKMGEDGKPTILPVDPTKQNRPHHPSKCKKCQKTVKHFASIEGLLPKKPPPSEEKDRSEGAEADVEAIGSPTTTADDDEEDTNCVICLDAVATMVFSHCGHRVVCTPCGKRIISGAAVATSRRLHSYVNGQQTEAQCPLCRSSIEFAFVLSPPAALVARNRSHPQCVEQISLQPERIQRQQQCPPSSPPVVAPPRRRAVTQSDELTLLSPGAGVVVDIGEMGGDDVELLELDVSQVRSSTVVSPEAAATSASVVEDKDEGEHAETAAVVVVPSASTPTEAPVRVEDI